ncbi:unnamed protein product, partial [Iphiclides podalirius]
MAWVRRAAPRPIGALLIVTKGISDSDRRDASRLISLANKIIESLCGVRRWERGRRGVGRGPPGLQCSAARPEGSTCPRLLRASRHECPPNVLLGTPAPLGCVVIK